MKKTSLKEIVRTSVKKHIHEILSEAKPVGAAMADDNDDHNSPKDPKKDMTNPHKNEPEAAKPIPAGPPPPNGPNDTPTSGESDASAQAHKLNLTGKPFGNFADDTGAVVAKSVNQGKNLVKIEPSSKLGDMAKSFDPKAHQDFPAVPEPKKTSLAKDTEPGYDPYADDAKTTLKHQKPTKDPRPAKAAATLMTKMKDAGKAKLWAGAKMAQYEKEGNTKDAIYFGEILKALASAEKAVEVPQDVKNTVRDTTAFSRAANPTSDMNAKIDKGIDDMNNEPSTKLKDMVPEPDFLNQAYQKLSDLQFKIQDMQQLRHRNAADQTPEERDLMKQAGELELAMWKHKTALANNYKKKPPM